MDSPTPDPVRFEGISPRLPVPDVERALAFYVDQLGLRRADQRSVKARVVRP
ncbi:MAG TPA: VOC family protein [Steroidobacteraceae bacterium]|nr:VOC family protein [Steroidobacteraceae bacterium]